MDMELKDCRDLAKAYQGRYEGEDTYLKRISNEVKARRGEYKSFGTYLPGLNIEAIAEKEEQNMKRFPTKIFVVSLASLAAAGIGIMAYFSKIRKKGS
jgi:hypothetical protein